MNIPVTTLEIQTLCRFSSSFDGKAVATDWPDETAIAPVSITDTIPNRQERHD